MDRINLSDFLNALIDVDNILHGKLVVLNDFPEEPVLAGVY